MGIKPFNFRASGPVQNLRLSRIEAFQGILFSNCKLQYWHWWHTFEKFLLPYVRAVLYTERMFLKSTRISSVLQIKILDSLLLVSPKSSILGSHGIYMFVVSAELIFC